LQSTATPRYYLIE